MTEAEIEVFPFVLAFLALGVIAALFARSSWGRGALLVVAVVLPAFVALDVFHGGSGFGPWLFMPVGVALIPYTAFFFAMRQGRD